MRPVAHELLVQSTGTRAAAAWGSSPSLPPYAAAGYFGSRPDPSPITSRPAARNMSRPLPASVQRPPPARTRLGISPRRREISRQARQTAQARRWKQPDYAGHGRRRWLVRYLLWKEPGTRDAAARAPLHIFPPCSGVLSEPRNDRPETKRDAAREPGGVKAFRPGTKRPQREFWSEQTHTRVHIRASSPTGSITPVSPVVLIAR
jgi:hypothetical protein